MRGDAAVPCTPWTESSSSPLTPRPRLGSLHKKNSPCVLHLVTNELLHAVAVLCAPHPQVLACWCCCAPGIARFAPHPAACQGKPCPCALAARAQGALLQRPTCYCLAQQQAPKGLPPSLRQKPTREQTKEKQTETTRDWELNQN